MGVPQRHIVIVFITVQHVLLFNWLVCLWISMHFILCIK